MIVPAAPLPGDDPATTSPRVLPASPAGFGPFPLPAGVPPASLPDAAAVTSRRRRGWRREVLTAVVVAVLVAALGAPLAWLWAFISPRVTIQMTAAGPAYTQQEPEGYMAAEGVYLLITLAAGVTAAVVVWLVVRRRRGPMVLAGLAAGSIAGAVLMAWLGHKIGLAEYERLLREAPVGARFERPVEVRTKVIDPPLIQGMVLVQAVAAVAVYTLLAAFSAAPSLRPGRARVAEPAGPPVGEPISWDWSVPPGRQVAPAPPAPGGAASPRD